MSCSKPPGSSTRGATPSGLTRAKRSRIIPKPGLIQMTPIIKKQGFQKEADSDKPAPIALPFEAYFANIGNLTWFGQALLVFGICLS